MSSRLTLVEREKIKEYLALGYSMRKIDDMLGYTHGTTRYEIKRNTDEGAEYDPIKAQKLTDERAEDRIRKNAVLISQINRKCSQEDLDYIQSRLDEGLSPEQVVSYGNLNISSRTLRRYISQGLLKVQKN